MSNPFEVPQPPLPERPIEQELAGQYMADAVLLEQINNSSLPADQRQALAEIVTSRRRRAIKVMRKSGQAEEGVLLSYLQHGGKVLVAVRDSDRYKEKMVS